MNEPYGVVSRPIRLDYIYSAGVANSGFLRAILDGRLLGRRCAHCAKAYLPARASCPTCGVEMTDEVEVRDQGTVTTFCIVNIPFPGMAVKPPFAAASIVLDGADIPIFHLLQEVAVENVRMGLRVEAVWKPPEQREPSMESIAYFRPSGEADAPYESYKDHL